MQTFLPYPGFRKSASVLDNKRLGKQRVESKQLLLALGVPVGEHTPKEKSSWANHPCAKMWAGHEMGLIAYSICVCDEWIVRGFRDTLREQFLQAVTTVCQPVMKEFMATGVTPEACEELFAKPKWLGNHIFHASHRSNLLRKDPEHYGQFGWNEPDDLDYVWPIRDQHILDQ